MEQLKGPQMKRELKNRLDISLQDLARRKGGIQAN